VQACKAECPLCRSPFDAGVKLACNTELRDLIALATASMMDDKVCLCAAWCACGASSNTSKGKLT
jgi:hypothetical protein